MVFLCIVHLMLSQEKIQHWCVGWKEKKNAIRWRPGSRGARFEPIRVEWGCGERLATQAVSERALVLSVSASVLFSGVSISKRGSITSSRGVCFSARLFICSVRSAEVAELILYLAWIWSQTALCMYVEHESTTVAPCIVHYIVNSEPFERRPV